MRLTTVGGMEVPMLKRAISLLSAVLLISATAAAALAAGQAPAAAPGSRNAEPAQANSYRLAKLVSDIPGEAAHLDRHLVNAWGLVAGPSTPWWVADADTGVSTLYDGTGAPIPLVVRVGGGPTGIVFNGGPGFVVEQGGEFGPSVFMFATESGLIRGWNPAVPSPSPSTRAFVVVNHTGKGSIYKGLAIASGPRGDHIYAADFHNARVEVFDSGFDPVRRRGAFVDPHIPDGFAPFGIQQIRGKIFVTYAKQDAGAVEDVTGPGLGFVDVFSRSGRLLDRVASRGELNAPWGLALAPAGFGRFSGDLLVGNFGDGKIHAYRWTPGGFHKHGVLRRPNGRVLAIDGLWALSFGNGAAAGPTTSLFFTAGPDDETHGLFGRIRAGA